MKLDILCFRKGKQGISGHGNTPVALAGADGVRHWLVAWKGVICRRLVTKRKILPCRAKVNLETKRMKASFCHVR